MTAIENKTQKGCDINTQYLITLFDKLRSEYPVYYILLQHTEIDLFVITQVYTHRNKQWAEIELPSSSPLQWISAAAFIENAHLYHKYDLLA